MSKFSSAHIDAMSPHLANCRPDIHSGVVEGGIAPASVRQTLGRERGEHRRICPLRDRFQISTFASKPIAQIGRQDQSITPDLVVCALSTSTWRTRPD